jgi:hypothetical protein
MRPIVTLAHAVGVVMCLYAIGVLATPHSGVTGFIMEKTFLTPPMIAAVFVGCGVYIFLSHPHPALFSLLITPIMLYSLASVLYVLTAGGAMTGTVAHTGIWLVVNASLVERARHQWIS